MAKKNTIRRRRQFTLTGVTITGENFRASATVTFGSDTANNIVVVDESTITCTAPDRSTPGFVDVTVDNQDGSAPVTLVDGFEYYLEDPTILSIDPDRGPCSN